MHKVPTDGGEDTLDNLPKVDTTVLHHYDPKTQTCRGFLHKKGGSKSKVMGFRRKWSERLFIISLDISDKENYTLKYMKEKDNKPRGELNLEGTVITIDAKSHSSAKVGYEFQIRGTRKETFEVYAISNEERQAWVKTLEYVKSVANARGKYMADLGFKVKRVEQFQSTRSGSFASQHSDSESSLDSKHDSKHGSKHESKHVQIQEEMHEGPSPSKRTAPSLSKQMAPSPSKQTEDQHADKAKAALHIGNFLKAKKTHESKALHEERVSVLPQPVIPPPPPPRSTPPSSQPPPQQSMSASQLLPPPPPIKATSGAGPKSMPKSALKTMPKGRNFKEEQKGQPHTAMVVPASSVAKSPTDGCALRLDVDLHAMSHGSSKRREFVARFQEDVARVCSIDTSEVCVMALREAPNLDWLTIVEFKFDLKPSSPEESVVKELLKSLIENEASTLYEGHVTCNIDSSFVVGLSGEEETKSHGSLAYNHSTDPAVQRVLDKYSQISAPKSSVGGYFFSIQIGSTLTGIDCWRDMWILNPRIFTRSACMVWPHDVIRSIGLSGTVQEMWLEPKQLVPVGMPKSLSAPIDFAVSMRSNGLPTIDASLLKAGLKYQVIFEDNRKDALNKLRPEEIDEIREVFHEFDRDDDGSISREETTAFAKSRTKINQDAIDEQYQSFIRENQDPGEQAKAQELREKHLQQLKEAEYRLLDMCRKADIDGDGRISLEEFTLAEAWWKKSTMNPTKVSLF